MVGIVLSDEQVRSAPPEVRRWLYSLMESTLQPGHDIHFNRGGFSYAGDDLAVCDAQEVLRIFSAIKDDRLATELFFRLGRDNYDRMTGRHVARKVTPNEMLDGTGLDQGGLDAALEGLNRVLQSLRGDPRAVLFRRDAEGAYLVHERTQWSIHQLLVHLIEAEKRAESCPVSFAPVSFTPPYRRPIEASG